MLRNPLLTTARQRLHPVAAAIILMLLVTAILSAPWPVLGQTQQDQVPARPTGLTGTVSPGAVSLSWDDPGDSTVTGYQVLRRNPAVDARGVFHVIAEDTAVSSTSYIDTTVSTSTPYVYRVKARNSVGLSPQSSLFRANVPAPEPEPEPTPSPTPEPTPEPTPAPTPEPGIDYAQERTDSVSLGDITDASAETRDANVDTADPVDYFHFSLRAKRDIGLRIRRLDLNADLYVEDNEGNVLHSSEKTGNQREVLNVTLAANESNEHYYVRVEGKEDGSNDYQFRYFAEAPPNVSPSGLPTIRGVVAVGQTLTVSTSGITDDNGLSNAVFTYQWVKTTDGADADISGETGSTYKITASDAGSSFKVTVAFTDDAGYSESLTSNSTETVPEDADDRQARAITPRAGVTYASNTGQTADASSLGTSSFDQAQGFTTGSQTGGYALGSIEIKLETGASGFRQAPDIKLVKDTPTGTHVATMTKPEALPAGATADYAYNAPASTTLDASTSYYIVLENASGQVVNTARTNSNADDSAGATGWSVHDSSHWRNANSTGSFSSITEALMIKVSQNQGGTSTDATLSGLALENPDDSSAISLNETFASTTTSYTADVVNAVDEITIDPTVNESNATVEYLDADDMALTDADTTEDDFQVALDVGENTIKVKVTAQDTSTTETYTVVVTRAALVDDHH